MYLSSALLLLWISGCFSEAIWGPKHVEYEENKMAIVTCHYTSGWENYVKWWCRGADWSSCKFVVKTDSKSMNDHVSIQDDVQAHIITVTIKAITKKDEDTYWCGIERFGSDHGSMIKLSVFPATTRTTTNIRTTTTNGTTSTGNNIETVNNYYERFEITDLQVLLPIIFGILLVILVGASILAWRMKLRQKKAEKLAEQGPQPMEENICYAHLTLQHRTSNDSPLDSPETTASLQTISRVSSIHKEVEYVTMASLKREDISYASLSLDTPDQNATYSNMDYLISHYPLRNPTENTEYKKPCRFKMLGVTESSCWSTRRKGSPQFLGGEMTTARKILQINKKVYAVS
ncbi:CMRF35-like molecule 1 isoform X2 [Macrotis lagotis]|uniref:CMRF35-like molecule 1 isoform X2 n=1 Tax=Macrotis lagotis TaxID=92651 RepID=UPI003D691D0E